MNLLENIKQGKIYLDQGKISKEDLKKIIDIDPTQQKKYIGWLSKIWITEKPKLDDLRNNIEEYNTFLNRNKAKTKDINKFKSFQDLKNEVNLLNQTEDKYSFKELESDYDIVLNNSDILIMSPHTHEASRKLGLAYFSYRDCGDGKTDSAWCTTYKSPDHFNDYYYGQNLTFYYIKIKSPDLIKKLKKSFSEGGRLIVTALVVNEDGDVDSIYDGDDHSLSKKDIIEYLNIIGYN